MKEINKAWIGLFSLSILSTASLASEQKEITFEPQVTISKTSSSHNLEITSGSSLYHARYDSKAQTFEPVEMIFQVKSKSETSVSYSLRMSAFNNYCKLRDGEETELTNVTSLLDGTVIVPSVSEEENDDKRLFTTTDIRHHRLILNYPEIPQTDESFHCYGIVGLTAELDKGTI